MQSVVRRIGSVLVLVGALVLFGAGPAGAQYTGVPAPNVGITDPGADSDVAVLGSRFAVAPASPLSASTQAPLAVTGGDILGLLLLAGLAVGGGALTVWAFRPAQAAPPVS